MRYCHKTNKNHVIDAIQILDNPDIYRLPDQELLHEMGVIVETGGVTVIIQSTPVVVTPGNYLLYAGKTPLGVMSELEFENEFTAKKVTQFENSYYYLEDILFEKDIVQVAPGTGSTPPYIFITHPFGESDIRMARIGMRNDGYYLTIFPQMDFVLRNEIDQCRKTSPAVALDILKTSHDIQKNQLHLQALMEEFGGAKCSIENQQNQPAQ